MAFLARIRSVSVAALAFALASLGFASSIEAQVKVHRIGILWDSPSVLPEALDALRKGLRDFGYVEGRNLALEYRWAEGNPARMREMAGELVRLKVDLIIAPSSVSTDRNDLYRRGAVFVDKILKGANPAELPVERATKFEFVLNTSTAQALGLEIPRPALLRADEVLR